MSDRISELRDRIRFHYREENNLEEFMGILRRNIQDLESIPYLAVLDGFEIPTREFEINDLAQQIARDMVRQEFSHFLSALPNANCENIETTLEDLPDTLNHTYDGLWDEGFEPTQLFASGQVRNEIIQRTETRGVGIQFSTRAINPTLANELGNAQIIISNNRCFGKTYPETIEETVFVFPRRGNRNQQLDCEIRQNFQFRNLDSMKRITITNMPSSE